MLPPGCRDGDGWPGRITLRSLGAFTFAGRFFRLFAAGAVFGRIMGDSHGAASVVPRITRMYLALGIEPAVLHRLVTMAAGGFDSLPHCGAVVVLRG